MKKTLTHVGRDSWSRPLYRDENGRIWVDVEPRSNYAPCLCTITDAGEPCDPMRPDMQAVSADIHTVCVGTAASMAAVLFAAGDRREILRHGEVMIHDPLVSGGISGSALTVQDKSNRLMDKRKVLCGILAEHTGKSLKQIYKVTGKDTYFGAEEAVEFGLADSIVEKMERRSA